MDDYISRETFIASVEKRYCDPCSGQGGDLNGLRCKVCWVNDMLGEVLDTPAADVKLGRYGRWIDEEDGRCRCSMCGNHMSTNWNYDIGAGWFYCPNCGAIMGGGKNERKWRLAKKIRETVYEKYGGRCAYCGRKIAYKDMQVDHFLPLRTWDIEDAGTDDITNLMPACRMCNHYKRANTLETFRRYIQEIPQKVTRELYLQGRRCLW